MAEKQSYPRIPEGNWWTLRNQFKKTLPNAVTTSYLKSLLNLTNDKSASNLISPLKQVGLIDDEYKPTARANDWRNDNKYRDVCNQMIEEIYPSELRDLFPGPDLDRDALKNWFMNTSSIGEGAANYNASMYILLKSSNPSDDTNLVKKEKPATKKLKVTDKLIKPIQKEVQKNEITSKSENSNNHLVEPSLNINLQIHISPEANSEQIESIFANMAKYLYRK